MTTAPAADEIAVELTGVRVFYGERLAVDGVTLPIHRHRTTAFIGPSGCGKSTVLRAVNRMNDLVPGARVEGTIRFAGGDLYAPGVDPVEVRRRIGMVFQKPSPFPKSIYENVAYGPRVLGISDRRRLDEIVERSLKAAFLWDEVKDGLKRSALGLSGGQQQRLCIARAIATNPEVILMDEPCSALDPIATSAIEELIRELVSDYTIVIVTHNMGQAQRISDFTAFYCTRTSETAAGHRFGALAEFAPTDQLFRAPRSQETASYLRGEFG